MQEDVSTVALVSLTVGLENIFGYSKLHTILESNLCGKFLKLFLWGGLSDP